MRKKHTGFNFHNELTFLLPINSEDIKYKYKLQSKTGTSMHSFMLGLHVKECEFKAQKMIMIRQDMPNNIKVFLIARGQDVKINSQNSCK